MTGDVSLAESPGRFSLQFSARDLVNVAIFAVIFIVVSYAIGMLGVISPPVWLILVPVSVLVNGLLALSILVAGFLGGLLGSSILRKHFVCAGLA